MGRLDSIFNNMYALTIFHLVSLGIEASNFWRALAVAALAVSVFVLKQYWQKLQAYPRRMRILIVLLRAMSLLLLVSALAGVRLNYESVTPGRLLVLYAKNENVSAEDSAALSSVEEIRIERTVAALGREGFEPVMAAMKSSAAFRPEHPESFAAAILLTDGAMRAARANLEVERAGAAAGGAPVYVVTNPKPSAGPRVSLESVSVQGRRVRGVPVTLRCVVHGRGMRGHESLLTVSDTARVQASSRVTWNNEDEWQTITLEVVPKVAGWTDYIARIEPAGGEDGAAVLSRPLTMYVEESRLRVLFFEGEPTWEAKFVRRALEQSGLFDLDYFAQVSRAATLGATTAGGGQSEGENAGQPAEADAGKAKNTGASPEAKLHAALRSATSLNAYDVIIVGATPNTMLSADEAARLSSWVNGRGGGLVIMGGNSFSGSIAAPGGKLYALMPTDIDPRGLASETQQISRGAPLEAERIRSHVALVPTEAGAVGPLSGYLSASEGQLAAALTGQGFSLRGLRPGANVLASAGQSAVSGASNSSSNGAGTPLIAAMRYGAGRVLAFAPADSWRIRTSASGAQDERSGPFGALWQGIALWTAEGARPAVEIVLDDESPAAGQLVTAEIRVRDASFASIKIDRVKARLQPLAEEVPGEAATTTSAVPPPQDILFQPDERDASVWRARFIAGGRGRFSLEADYVANREGGSASKLFGIVARTLVEAGAANDTLRRAARERGGDLFAADEINTLLERLSAQRLSAVERVRRTWELRTWPPLAFLIALLLSGEWLARRIKAGMRDEG